MAMIYCKECGKEISDKADKCPHCGCPMQSTNAAPQANSPKSKEGKVSGLSITALIFSILGCTFIVGVILAIIDLCVKDGRKKTCSIIALVISGLWIIIGVANMGNSDKPEKVGNTSVNTNVESDNDSKEMSKENTESTEPESKETTFKKGEIAELNGVQVTLTDYKESSGSDFNTPTDGNVFLMAEFEIANNTEKELAISSVMSFDAYTDDYSLNYSFSALMEKDGNQLDGTIAAGKKMKGWIGWEVPQDYQNVEIHFTDNVWSNNKFVFLIER